MIDKSCNEHESRCTIRNRGGLSGQSPGKTERSFQLTLYIVIENVFLLTVHNVWVKYKLKPIRCNNKSNS
jgi:hypothetical protein